MLSKLSQIGPFWYFEEPVGPGPGISSIVENSLCPNIEYRTMLSMRKLSPLQVSAERKSELDIKCTVIGGGLSGQAGAIRPVSYTHLTLPTILLE